MSNPSAFYLSHMFAQTRYRATWDPTKRLMIGAVGKLDRGVFNIYTSLEKEGIAFDFAASDAGASMDYTSHDSVSINVKLSGTAPAAGSALGEQDAGFSFDFKGDRGVVFQTANHKLQQLINLSEIESSVLKKYAVGNWDKEWVIVTELVEADSGTIIISNSSNGTLELKAATPAGEGPIALADSSLGLSVVREKGSTLKYIAQKSLTPLYRVMGIQHPLFGADSFSVRNLPSVSAPYSLMQLDFDERELLPGNGHFK